VKVPGLIKVIALPIDVNKGSLCNWGLMFTDVLVRAYCRSIYGFF
jgi:hypothetical protein